MRTWSIIEDLKGMPTHEEGGVDLTVVDGVPLIHGGKVRASNGLHISREDIDRKKAKIQAMKKARGSNTISIEKQKFYDTYSPYALELEKKEGIPAEASLSQMWIETGGGKFDIEKSGGNPFGIFAWDDYEGDVTMIDTSEHLSLEDIREENGKKVWGKRSYPVLNEPTPIDGTDKYYVETQRPLIDVKGDYNKAFELYGNTIKNTNREGYKYALENKSDYRRYLSGVVMGGYGTGVNYGSEAIKHADEFHNYRKSLERGYEWSDYPEPEKQELEMPITNTTQSNIKAKDGLVINPDDPPYGNPLGFVSSMPVQEILNPSPWTQKYFKQKSQAEAKMENQIASTYRGWKDEKKKPLLYMENPIALIGDATADVMNMVGYEKGADWIRDKEMLSVEPELRRQRLAEARGDDNYVLSRGMNAASMSLGNFMTGMMGMGKSMGANVMERIGQKGVKGGIGSWMKGEVVEKLPKVKPISKVVISSVDDVAYPVTRTTPNSGYTFKTISPNKEKIAIHESNKYHDVMWVAKNDIDNFFINNKIDVSKLPESKLVGSEVGYDWILPEGITHDMLNEFARLHHGKPITQEMRNIAKAIKEANPNVKFSGTSHELHGIASNIHPDYLGKIGQGLSNVDKAGSKVLSKTDDIFKSEIDWAKWNKEIPENKALMQEYNAIEQAFKETGTWMKNPDGSVFKGTPEQFVQQQSNNFKKAFPEGYDKTYRGDSNHFVEFKKDKKIYTTGKIENAAHYTAANNPGFWNPEKHTIGQNVKFTMPESSEEINKLIKEASKTGDYSEVDKYQLNKIVNSDSGGLRELYSTKSKNSFTIDAKGKEWTNIPFEGKEMPTDFVAEDLFNKNLDYINIKNVRDPYLDNLKIINSNRVNLKSAIGNNGMFDMTNPNIYKSLIPLLGYKLISESQKNKKN